LGIELHDDGLYVVRLVASYIGIGRKSLFVAVYSILIVVPFRKEECPV
jgi:hypothetical protein